MASASYFRFNIMILKLAGLWPPNCNALWKNLLLHAYNFVIMTLTCVFHYGLEVVYIFALRYDIERMLSSMAWLTTYSVAVYKVVLWYIKRRNILELIAIMDKQEYQYEACDNFDPEAIMNDNHRVNHIYLSLHFWIGQTIPFLCSLGAIVSVFSKQNDDNGFMHDNQTQICNPPFTTYILWATDTHLKCILAIVVQGIGTVAFGFVIIASDGMLTSSVSFITAHCHVLCGAFQSLLPRALAKRTKENKVVGSKDLDELLNLEMNKCVKHLQMLISATDQIEDSYKFQTLTMALVTVFVLCNNLYLISTMPVSSKGFLGQVSFLVTASIEFSSYCWFGNELTLAFADIPASLYKSDWIEFDGKVKRTMLTTMTRMSKPVMLSLGKFSPLTLNTLVSTFRGSYSFFAILKQMNE